MQNRCNKGSPLDLEIEFEGRRKKHAKTYGEPDKSIIIHSNISTKCTLDMIDLKFFLHTKQKIDYLCRDPKYELPEKSN